MKRGKLIVFEGVDAVGKTTLSNDLCSYLSNLGTPFKRCQFPGKEQGTLGELVYKIHHSHKEDFSISEITPCSLQLLHIAAHIDTIESKIKPTLLKGAWIILDRFWWSTYVYGLNSDVPRPQLDQMIAIEQISWGDISPDIIFLIDSHTPLRQDESETRDRQIKRDLYNELCTSNQMDRCVRISTSNKPGMKDKAIEQIRNSVQRLD